MGKLVRDKIVDIIKADCRIPKYKILSKVDYRNSLREKLIEEATEVFEAKAKKDIIEELADVQEVIDCILLEYKISLETVKEAQRVKREKRGSFLKKIFLFLN